MKILTSKEMFVSVAILTLSWFCDPIKNDADSPEEEETKEKNEKKPKRLTFHKDSKVIVTSSNLDGTASLISVPIQRYLKHFTNYHATLDIRSENDTISLHSKKNEKGLPAKVPTNIHSEEKEQELPIDVLTSVNLEQTTESKIDFGVWGSEL